MQVEERDQYLLSKEELENLLNRYKQARASSKA